MKPLIIFVKMVHHRYDRVLNIGIGIKAVVFIRILIIINMNYNSIFLYNSWDHGLRL